jgi:hypothetical protein
MTDPNTPSDPNTPPPAAPPYGSAPPPAAPQYSAAPPAPYGEPASAPVPGKTLGIVAFVLSFFIQLVALVLGIVALVQSRKAGQKNGFALAAIIISSILIVIGIIVAIVVIAVVVPAVTEEFMRLCSEYGNGVHEIDGTTVTLQGCPS